MQAGRQNAHRTRMRIVNYPSYSGRVGENRGPRRTMKQYQRREGGVERSQQSKGGGQLGGKRISE